MSSKIDNRSITNAIFRKFGVALGLKSDEKLQLLRDAGWNVSKSKCHSWGVGVQNKNWEPMPEEALDAALEYLAENSGDALVSWVAQDLAGQDFHNESERILPALDRLIELMRGDKPNGETHE